METAQHKFSQVASPLGKFGKICTGAKNFLLKYTCNTITIYGKSHVLATFYIIIGSLYHFAAGLNIFTPLMEFISCVLRYTPGL